MTTLLPNTQKPEAFREAMRSPASSVVIVATGDEGARAGCTVTAICSLSDSPPSLLVCLNRRSSALAAIISNGRFSANYLDESQIEIANVFAGRSNRQGNHRFGQEWEQAKTGMPVLQGAVASFECELVRTDTFGSHDVLIGRVVAGISRIDCEPLVYSRGSYCQLA